MKKLNLKKLKALSKAEQKSINGGYGDECAFFTTCNSAWDCGSFVTCDCKNSWCVERVWM